MEKREDTYVEKNKANEQREAETSSKIPDVSGGVSIFGSSSLLRSLSIPALETLAYT